MTLYLDSSAVMRLVLGERGRIEKWTGYAGCVTSRLTEVECLRTLDRLRIIGAVDSDGLVERHEAVQVILRAMAGVDVSRDILRRAAEPFPAVLHTLDAIHLATAMAWAEENGRTIVMGTHDVLLAQAARSKGLEVVGV